MALTNPSTITLGNKSARLLNVYKKVFGEENT
jgi:hypothetical protein